MTTPVSLAPLLQRYFTDRLMKQRRASPHTVCSYRDTFRLLLNFLEKRLRKAPSDLFVDDIDTPSVVAFLDELENQRKIHPRSRNLRLTAIRSFFRFLSFELPTHAGQIQRVLAIPGKRYSKRLVGFLSRKETEALLRAPDPATWAGRRDHALMLLAVQAGLRLSELIGLRKEDLSLAPGAHVRVMGKGRKERCTPLAKRTTAALRHWLREPSRGDEGLLFTNACGRRFSPDGVQYVVAKHASVATKTCPSIAGKRVTPHVLRHTAAMELLLAGVDRTVIALWLGHESLETTQIYLDADLAIKEKALAKVSPIRGKVKRYKPGDKLLAFLSSL